MPTTQHHVCLYWDIENSTGLRSQLTTPVWETTRRQVVTLFKSCLPEENVVTGSESFFGGKLRPARIISDNGDGDLAIFVSSKDAVETALKFQWKVSHHDWNGIPIRVCIGIDGGDTDLRETDDHGILIPTGKVLDNGSRVASIARPGQILVTARVSADARDHMSQLPNEIRHREDGTELKLHFAKHGFFDYQGRLESDDLLFVCEVGILDVTPFESPPNSAKCWPCDDKGTRIVTEKPEWQPIQGALVPGNTGGSWELVRKLGSGGFGEAWLAIDQHTRVDRVFKFPNDPQRARSFFRETTLSTFVQKQLARLGDAHHANAIAKVLGITKDAPYWIATEHYPEGSLSDWCASQSNGIASLDPAQRIQFVIELCRAVHAAHQVEVIHRDIKPGNIFIRHDPRFDTIHPILADFGIGCILRPELLDEEGYTRAGFTHPNTLGPGSRTGTSMYAPPEYEKMGAKASPKGDVYSIGVLLYQMLIGDFTQPWESAQECERRIPDRPDPDHPDSHLNPFIRKAILKALDAEDHRFASAEAFAEQLATLQRDYEEDEATKAKEEAARQAKLRVEAEHVAALQRDVAKNALIAQSEAEKKAQAEQKAAANERRAAKVWRWGVRLASVAGVIFACLALWALRAEREASDNAQGLKTQSDVLNELFIETGLRLRTQNVTGRGSGSVPNDMIFLLPHVLSANKVAHETDVERLRLTSQRLTRLCEWLDDSNHNPDHYEKALEVLRDAHRKHPEDEIILSSYLDALLLARRWAHTFTENISQHKDAEYYPRCKEAVNKWSQETLAVVKKADPGGTKAELLLHAALAYGSLSAITEAHEKATFTAMQTLAQHGPHSINSDKGKEAALLQQFATKYLTSQSLVNVMPWEQNAALDVDAHPMDNNAAKTWQQLTELAVSMYKLRTTSLWLKAAWQTDVTNAEVAFAALKTGRQNAKLLSTEGKIQEADATLDGLSIITLQGAAPQDEIRLAKELAEINHQQGHLYSHAGNPAASAYYEKWFNNASLVVSANPDDNHYKVEQIRARHHQASVATDLGLEDEASKRASLEATLNGIQLFEKLPDEIQKKNFGLLSSLQFQMSFHEGENPRKRDNWLVDAVDSGRAAVAASLNMMDRLGAEGKLATALTMLGKAKLANNPRDPGISEIANEGIKIISKRFTMPGGIGELGVLLSNLYQLQAEVTSDKTQKTVLLMEAIKAAQGLSMETFSNRTTYYGALISSALNLFEQDEKQKGIGYLHEALKVALQVGPKLNQPLHPYERSKLVVIGSLLPIFYYSTSDEQVHLSSATCADALRKLYHELWLGGQLNEQELGVLRTSLRMVAMAGLLSVIPKPDQELKIPEGINSMLELARQVESKMSSPSKHFNLQHYLPTLFCAHLAIRGTDAADAIKKHKENLVAIMAEIEELCATPELSLAVLIFTTDLTAANGALLHFEEARSTYSAANSFYSDAKHGLAGNSYAIRSLLHAATRLHLLNNNWQQTQDALDWHDEVLRMTKEFSLVAEKEPEMGASYEVVSLDGVQSTNRLFHHLMQCARLGAPSVLQNPSNISIINDNDEKFVEHEIRNGRFTSANLRRTARPTKEADAQDFTRIIGSIESAEKAFHDQRTGEARQALIDALLNAAFHGLKTSRWPDAKSFASQAMELAPDNPRCVWMHAAANFYTTGSKEELNRIEECSAGSPGGLYVGEDILTLIKEQQLREIIVPAQNQLIKAVIGRAGVSMFAERSTSFQKTKTLAARPASANEVAEKQRLQSKLKEVGESQEVEIFTPEKFEAVKKLPYEAIMCAQSALLTAKWSECKAAAIEAINASPNEENAHALLSLALLNQGKLDQAFIIMRAHWQESVDGWTFGKFFAMQLNWLEAVGLTHPGILKIKEEMAKLSLAASQGVTNKVSPTKR